MGSNTLLVSIMQAFYGILFLCVPEHNQGRAVPLAFPSGEKEAHKKAPAEPHWPAGQEVAWSKRLVTRSVGRKASTAGLEYQSRFSG